MTGQSSLRVEGTSGPEGDPVQMSLLGDSAAESASALPGVSFVIPVYNKAPYLPDVLTALVAQEGDFPRQFVFVDDGSTDGSLEIVEEHTRNWDNVVIHRQTNHGSAHATNQGIFLATQPYIKFVDADDLLHRRATVTLLEALLQKPQACLAYGRPVYYESPDQIDLTGAVDVGEPIVLASPLRAALRNSLFNPTQFLVKTACAQAVGGCDEGVVHSQEYSLTLRLARCWDFVRVNAPLAYLPKQVAGSLGSKNNRQLQRVSLACARFLEQHPDLPYRYKYFALRRASGRAWKFAHRQRGVNIFSKWFWRNWLSYLPQWGSYAAKIERTLEVYEGE